MKYSGRAFGLLILTTLLLAFNNCTQTKFQNEGTLEKIVMSATVTGNPLTTAAKTLVAKSCQVLTNCHTQATLSDCEANFLKATGIDYQLGLPKDSVLSFSEIIQSESSGALSANASGTDSCLQAIERLTCSDSLVQAAFDPTATNPYSKIVSMIPTSPGSCPSIFSQPPARTEYYVSPSGSDLNDGSREKPWATITHASQALVLGAEGATVHVTPGSYVFNSIQPCAPNVDSCGIKTIRSGTAAAPIIYLSDQQWEAQISAPNSWATWYNSGDHVQIVGFEITGQKSTNIGVISEGSFGKLIGNHIHDIPVTTGCSTGYGGAGIYFGYFPGPVNNDAIGNWIHDIGPALPDGLPQSSYCANLAHGISYAQPKGRVQNNILYRIANWGISSTRSASELTINHNLIFSSGVKTNLGVLIGGGILISAQSGFGVHTNSTVTNNIIRNNSGQSITEWDSVGSGNIYQNNLLFQNGGFYSLKGGGVPPSGTITSDPQMVSFNQNGGGNYQLLSTSPAINSASSACTFANLNCMPVDDFLGFRRPSGGTADLGPYEWHP